MFLVIKKVNDLEYLVLDTQDGAVEKVNEGELVKARSYGFKIKENDSMRDYVTVLKSLTKAKIMHTEITYSYKRDLYEKLRSWGSKIKALPKLKKFKDSYSLDLLAFNTFFVFVVNEAWNVFYNPDNGDAYLFIIKDNGIFGKVFNGTYLDVQYISALNLSGVETVTFNEKIATKKRGRLSNVFASLLNKI